MTIAKTGAAWVAYLVCLLVPVAAWSQIYKWTDDKGGTVYSNIRPADTKNVKEFEVVIEEEKAPRIAPPASARAYQAAQGDAVRRQQDLENRVAELEQQLQVQQYQGETVPPDYYANGSAYSGYGYPYGYGVSYVIPSRVISSRVIASRRIVNSGPVFAAPRPFLSPGFPGPRVVTHSVGSPGVISPRSGGMGTGRH